MVSIEEIAVFAKKKGFVFPSSEIYGGFSGFFDYGPLGVELKNNIKNSWWKSMVHDRENVVGIDGSIISSEAVWKASGHLENFADVLVECKKCKKKVRLDHLIEDQLKIKTEGMNADEMGALLKKNNIKCNECKKGEFGNPIKFNLMFNTAVGPHGNEIGYLRAETAQMIFTNFKNVVDTSRVKLPFGIAQIGKAFRNEISPRNFLFRMREFEQMEMEFFMHPEKKNDCLIFKEIENVKANVLTSKEQPDGKMQKMTIAQLLDKKIIKTKWHAYWIGYRYKWFLDLGITPERLRLREHVPDELSHYSLATWDIEYNYEFGWKELEGIADRTNFDLKQHAKFSKIDLSYFDPETNERVVPHVIEPSVGVDRILLTLMIDSYFEEEVKGEKRVVLKLKPNVAPFRVAILPLVKKDGLAEKATELFNEVKNKFNCFYDESGSIGRRYRRMDEVGTPFCITVDHQTLEDGTVTIRNRDTMEQKRIKIKEIEKSLS
ncbi:MAG: glycine--tRNA ligase [Candidatus Aenigmarchaeota archaeon]|nr:glycine--tRNA ligase [Candidatus Aenigmarchaeota archaeon]